MKRLNILVLIINLIGTIIIFNSCEKNDTSTDIVYKAINKNYILTTDIDAMNSHDTIVAQHVDSILSGFIEVELISTGYIRFDLDGDTLTDMAFEIINLLPYNNNEMPEHLDTLAVRAYPFSAGILDNSTYKYADALDIETTISQEGNWTNQFVVLGTLAHGGQFNGKGEKYLAIRLNGENDFRYGWMKIYISEHNDTLRVIEYAYNKIEGSEIRAGQKE
ncbi:MAG: hypothetical protein PHH30_05450 [Bacteroidales bacterium]|nr:hypothetical protein [Bacteroidales bacterium]MDD3859978.1 hypothetical protein [Bacteroidales bacterium]